MTYEKKVVLKGRDEVSASILLILCFYSLIMCAHVLLVFGGILFLFYSFLICVVVSLLGWVGFYYRCEVTSAGIYITRSFFFIPWRRRMLPLDVQVRSGWWDEDSLFAGEGFFFEGFDLNGERLEEDAMGPCLSESRLGQEIEKIEKALNDIRRITKWGPRFQIHCRELSGQVRDLEAKEWDEWGWIKRAVVKAPLWWRGVYLPVGSELKFRMASEVVGYRDPQREDFIEGVTCAGPVELPNGLVVQRGAKISWNFDRYFLREGFGEALFYKGVWIDEESIVFDAQWKLVSAGIAKQVVIDGQILPVGTKIHGDFESRFTAWPREGLSFKSFRAPRRVFRRKRPSLKEFICFRGEGETSALNESRSY